MRPAVLLVFLLASCRPATAPPRPVSPVDPTAAVRVQVRDPVSAEEVESSGFFVADDLVLTCCLPVRGRGLLGVVTVDGRKLEASVVAEDEAVGLAVLRTEGRGVAPPGSVGPGAVTGGPRAGADDRRNCAGLRCQAYAR